MFRDGNETFVVEELIAQILEKAREFAQDYTGRQGLIFLKIKSTYLFKINFEFDFKANRSRKLL